MVLNDGSKRIGENTADTFAAMDPFAANDEGYRLLHEGNVEDGLRLLRESALAGVPWALATYSWYCLMHGQESRALTLAEEALPACQAFVVRQSTNPDLSSVAVYQLANARSNLSLCHLATGGDERYALDAWQSGAEVGHAESAFYPAVLAWRHGQQPEADRLVDALAAPIRAGLTSDMEEGASCPSPWFSAWCADGLSLLGRAPQDDLTADAIDLERALHLTHVGAPGVLPDSAWDVLRLVQSTDQQAAERGLRELIDEGGVAAHPARMELGVLLVENADPLSERYREGWNLLTRSLHAPYRDVIAASAWNIAAEYQRRGDAGRWESFGHVALELGDPTALRHYAAVAEEAGDDDTAVALYERMSDEVAPGHPARLQARAFLARRASSVLSPRTREWFLGAQGSVTAEILASTMPLYLWKGHYNVDVASASVSTRFFESCDCTFEARTAECDYCGRGPKSTLETASGAGDGAYPVFQLLPTEEGLRDSGALTLFSQTSLPALGATASFADQLDPAAPLILGTIDCHGRLIFADSSACLDGRDVSITVSQPEGSYVVLCWVGASRYGNDFFPVAMAALSGAVASDIEARLPKLSVADRDAIILELWGDPGRLVHSLIADMRPDVATGNYNILVAMEDDASLEYLAQMGELLHMETSDPDLINEVRRTLSCGSERVLEALEARGYLEPDLPWWQTQMKNHPGDIWGRVQAARDSHQPISDGALSDVRWVRRALARHPRLSAQQASVLAPDTDPRVRLNLARNPVTPSSVLLLLSRDADPAVRASVSAHDACPPELLEQLGREGRFLVSVAANPNTPAATLERLVHSDRVEVRIALARNRALPVKCAHRLANDPEARVRAALAANPGAPADIIQTLSLDPDEDVRQGAMGNPSATDEARLQASLLGAHPPRPEDLLRTPETQVGAAPKFCVMCGTRLAPIGNFCAQCGAPVTQAPTPLPGDPPANRSEVDAAVHRDESATSAIIDRVDVTAMQACFHAAYAEGNLEVAEFWALEIATASDPATNNDQVSGLELLCEKVLVPQRRFEEATLYCRWALTLPDPSLRERARHLQSAIDQARQAAGALRFEHHGDWQFVDLTTPGIIGQSQRAHYLRLIAFLRDLDNQGGLDDTEGLQRENFMLWITSYFAGFAPEAATVGTERETLANAMADWLDLR